MLGHLKTTFTRALRLVLCVAVPVCFAAPVASDTRPQGLLWNRTGQPATLPLQVKTAPGADFLLHLHTPDAAEPVLAAYIRGGAFFRVLVPAGRYELVFASGPSWLGEEAEFGPDTMRFVLAPPLAFRATTARKNGHLIDLRDLSAITVRDFAICQNLSLAPRPPLQGLNTPTEGPFPESRQRRYVDVRPELREVYDNLVLYEFRYETRSQVCD